MYMYLFFSNSFPFYVLRELGGVQDPVCSTGNSAPYGFTFSHKEAFLLVLGWELLLLARWLGWLCLEVIREGVDLAVLMKPVSVGALFWGCSWLLQTSSNAFSGSLPVFLSRRKAWSDWEFLFYLLPPWLPPPKPTIRHLIICQTFLVSFWGKQVLGSHLCLQAPVLIF